MSRLGAKRGRRAAPGADCSEQSQLYQRLKQDQKDFSVSVHIILSDIPVIRANYMSDIKSREIHSTRCSVLWVYMTDGWIQGMWIKILSRTYGFTLYKLCSSRPLVSMSTANIPHGNERAFSN